MDIMPVMKRNLWITLCRAAIVAAGAFVSLCAVGQEPVPAEVPKILLCAPVNVTYAANHLQYWHDKGIDGFILHGIWDGLDQELRCVQENGSEEHPLLREVRMASTSLCESGVTRNFLYVPLEPEDRWFVPWGQLHPAEGRFRAAGEFCQKAGLRGIVFDLCPQSLIHDYRWDGYDLKVLPPDELQKGAREFGRKTIRAFIGAYPEAEILFLMESLHNAGPLCLYLLEGLIESVGMADTIPLRLLLPEESSMVKPDQISAFAAATQHFLLNHLTAENQQRWNRQGGVGLGLKPLGFQDGKPAAYHSLDEFRVQLAAAKTVSTGYVWLDGREGGWWSMDSQEAQSYGSLLQGGRAAIAATPPLPEKFKAYTGRTPLDGLTRVGRYKGADIFGGSDGAAAVYWNGLRETLTLDGRATAAPVVLLRSGEQRMIPVEDNKVVVNPLKEPFLVKTLPFREWGVPAGMWMEAEAELSPKQPRSRVSFGYVNRSELSIQGLLEAWPPANVSIGTASFAVDLAPGGNASFQRTLQGIFTLGMNLDFRMTLTIPGGSLIERTSSLDVSPPLDWKMRADAAPTGNPAVTDFEGDRLLDFVFASARGDIHCVDALGTKKWEQRFSAGFLTAPVSGRALDGTRSVAAGDRNGNIHLFNGQGAMIRSLALSAPCSPRALIFSDLMDQPYDVLVAGLNDGKVVFLPGGSMTGWEYSTGGVINSLGCASNDEDLFYPTVRGNIYAALGKPQNSLLCLDMMGKLRWHKETQAQPSSPPYVIHPPGVYSYQVMLGTADGKIRIWDALSGISQGEINTKSNLPITGLLLAEVDPAEENSELLAVDRSGVYCFSAGKKLLWHAPAPRARGLAMHLLEGEPCIVTGTNSGMLYGCGMGGRMRWRDAHAAGALLGSPIIQDTDADRRVECVYAAEDHFVRSLELGPVNAPAAPKEASTLK